MGDRISISFRKGNKESVALFAHWAGLSFVNDAKNYVKKLNSEIPELLTYPLTRREPNIVMLDFIRQFFGKSKRIMLSYHLGKDQYDGDNSDNGHHIIDL